MRREASPYSVRSNSNGQLCQRLSSAQVYNPVTAPPSQRHLSNTQGMACVVRGMLQVEPYNNNNNNKHVSRAFERNVVCNREIAAAQNLYRLFVNVSS